MNVGRRDIAAVASSFWTDAGGGEDFPRNIERAIALTLPLTIVRLPELNTASLSRRLLGLGVGVRVQTTTGPSWAAWSPGAAAASSSCTGVMTRGNNA